MSKTNTTNLSLPLSLEVSDSPDIAALIIPNEQGSSIDLPESLYRLYYIQSAEISACLNSNRRRICAGQLIALAPEETVKFENDVQLLSVAFHYQFFCVHIKKDEFFCDGVVFNRVNQDPVCTIPPSTGGLIERLFDEIHQAISIPTELSQSRTISALHSILLQVAECMMRESNNDSSRMDREPSKSELTLRFESILDIHYHLRHDVQFYADALHVTPSRLNRRLKSELGKSPSGLIQDRLAVEARRRLTDGKVSIKEVALLLGFQDQLYFSRFFRKHFGVSPTEYFKTPAPEIDNENAA